MASEENHNDQTEELTVSSPSNALTYAPGDSLGQYVVDDVLGAGGHGTVYAAHHPIIGKQVAIKVLHPRFRSDPRTVQRFVKEAKLINEIRHPNIIDVFAFGETTLGDQYFVMDRLPGKTLSAYLLEPVSLEFAVATLLQLCGAISAIHGAGLIHRDLKPANIFISNESDELKATVLDFGIAKLHVQNDEAQDELATETGTVLGTPGFIAPEQATQRAVDER
ncbi:MAG: serine/threonine-protein kinase, partial [Myxococcota bacterium]